MRGLRLATHSFWRNAYGARVAIAKLRSGQGDADAAKDIATGAMATLVNIADYAPTETLRKRCEREIDLLAGELALASRAIHEAALLRRSRGTTPAPQGAA